jgi:gephyrin
MGTVKVGILTVSDSCSNGSNVDISGNNLAEFVVSKFGKSGWEVSQRTCVPDEQSSIKNVLLKWSDEIGLQVIHKSIASSNLSLKT